MRDNVFLDRLISLLSASFAALATLMAALGLYGVLAYTIAQRTREFGLRMALGADPAQLRGLVLWQVARMTLVGGTIGLAAALGLGTAARSLLYGLEGYDPLVVSLSVVLLMLVAFGAGLLPALRASRINPVRPPLAVAVAAVTRRRSIMRRLRLAAVVIALLLVAGSVSYSCGRTYTFVDEANAPVDPIYVAFYHSGSRPNPVHPVSYRASTLRVIRSDAPGQLAIPGKLHVHLPFPIETHPSVEVELVYAPRVHNAWGRLHVDAPSMPGLFGLDQNRRKATVSDLSTKPDAWQGTLSNLSSVINRLVAPAVDGRRLVSTDSTTVALTRELIGHFRSELAAFLTTFEETPRQKPEMPPYARWSGPEEQKRWAESVEADLAREPTWGALIRRRYTDELRYFAAWEAEAR